MKKLLKIIGKIILSLILIVLLAVATVFLLPLCEKVDRTPVEGSSDWMSALDDSVTLDNVVIPGTHDSATRFSNLAFFARCQDLSIKDQLESGFRFLDIRLALDEDKLKLVHGFVDCLTGPFLWSEKLYLDSVIETCVSFLHDHPSEFIMFMTKLDNSSDPYDIYQNALDRYIERYSDIFLLSRTVPTVSEARGKIVLLRRYPVSQTNRENAGMPICWTDQPGRLGGGLSYSDEENEFGNLRVQDRYEYSTEEKWDAFTASLSGDGIVFDFLSTKGPLAYGHPFRYARELNKKLLEYNLNEAREGAVIIVDFGNEQIAKHIYMVNFPSD